jgi:hypothetical protein
VKPDRDGAAMMGSVLKESTMTGTATDRLAAAQRTTA